jgi:hypothetical protein|tara:strand:+ start:285 stop:650 length:366 start_codon:yes stop_codon:yes gene_type:complete
MTDSIIIVCMFGFIVGWSLNTMYRQYKDEVMFKQIMTKIGDEEEVRENKIRSIFPMCYIEREDGMFLMYNKDTDEYMCQGDSYEELAKKVYTDLKIDVCLAKSDDKAMWFIAGATKELIDY